MFCFKMENNEKLLVTLLSGKNPYKVSSPLQYDSMPLNLTRLIFQKVQHNTMTSEFHQICDRMHIWWLTNPLLNISLHFFCESVTEFTLLLHG